MKILIDARTFGTRPSGIGIYAYNFLCGILQDFEVILVTDLSTSSEMQNLKKKGVRIIEYGKEVYRSSGVFAYFRFVRKILREEQPELFWEPNILIPIKLSGYQGKTLITIHDMFPVTMPQYFGKKYNLYFTYMLKRTLKRTDLILYNSFETKKETEQYFPKAAKVASEVLYIIVPRVEYDGEIRNENYFLYVGNVEKRKGVIAGKKREEDVDAALSALISRHPDRVTYKGYVSDEEKTHLYACADTVLFQSRAEGFGICALEAMSFGKPVLASDLSIFQEIVGDAISYFPLEGGAKALCDAMLQGAEAPDPECYEMTMRRYFPETLIPRLVELLKKTGKKN